MKGLATVRLLAELERHTGKRIHEMFDLIGGVDRVGGCMHARIGDASAGVQAGKWPGRAGLSPAGMLS